ncbi:hypothetical protein ACLB1T_02740 [Escherichia coli]
MQRSDGWILRHVYHYADKYYPRSLIIDGAGGFCGNGGCCFGSLFLALLMFQ